MYSPPRSTQQDICALLEQRGQAFASLGQYEKARFEFQGALTAARAISDWARECTLLSELGHCEFLMFSTASNARAWYINALEVYKKHNLDLPFLKGRIVLNLGHLEAREGRVDRAEQYYQEAVTIGKLVDGKLIYRRSLEGRAVIASMREDWQAMINYLQEAIDVVEVPIHESYTVWENLGYAYLNLGQYAAAELELNRMVALSTAPETKEYKARGLFKLGLNAELQDKLSEALDFYQASATQVQTPEAMIGIARIYYPNNETLGLFMAKQGQQLLEQETFSPLQDYTLEWTTLLRIRGNEASAGANQWIMEVLKCLPPTFPFWKSITRRNLLRLARGFDTGKVRSS